MNDLSAALINNDGPLGSTLNAQATAPYAEQVATQMGPMLVAAGKLGQKDLSLILALQKRERLRFGEAALKLGLVQVEDVNAILAEQFAYTQTPAPSSQLDHRLSALFQPDSPQAEALRSLRSELMLRYFNTQSQRSLAIVSAEDAEGSALATADLAICFAQLRLRTLLIDTNLRAPQLNRVLHLPEQMPGLSDWLAKRTAVAPTPIAAVRSLWVLPAGTRAPNPQELLAGKPYQERLAALTQQFDITLISTSPLDSNRDAQIVAAQSGAALLLARQHQTRTQALAAICQRLRDLGVRLVGAAMLGPVNPT